MGRPAKEDREEIGKMICPICGESVSVYRGYHGTGYSNHGGHGFKLTKKQLSEFFSEEKQKESHARFVLKKIEEEKKKLEYEQELRKDGFSIFNMEF